MPYRVIYQLWRKPFWCEESLVPSFVYFCSIVVHVVLYFILFHFILFAHRLPVGGNIFQIKPVEGLQLKLYVLPYDQAVVKESRLFLCSVF